MSNNLIIRLNGSNSLQTSLEGVKINKIVSSISPLNFVKLLKKADNKVNPRTAKVNSITKSIQETLESSPELFWLKSKGILLSTEFCSILERNRVEISLSNLEFEGIMDGGHNTFAIATFIIEKLFKKTIKNWDDCKSFWEENYDEIIKKIEERKDDFKFSIPIEIIAPNEEDGSLEDFYDFIAEICSARNNNVQLSETAKGNQVGYYETLKQLLDSKFDVIWKAGDTGKIKSEDVISLSTLPLIFLSNNNILPKELKSLNKISLYSQKSRCVDFYNSLMEHPDICRQVNGKFILENSYVESALGMTEDILRFFDNMYIEFPNLYHNASPGKFGRITAVKHNVKSKVPFFSTLEEADYQYSYGFFYPIISGLTNLMELDQEKKIVKWRINPLKLDLSKLDLTQYVNIIKLVNFDPQKIGKGDVFYKESEAVFEKIS